MGETLPPVSLTRAEIFGRLNSIEQRINQLSRLINQKMEQQATAPDKILYFRSKRVQTVFDFLFKQYSLSLTITLTLFILSLVTVLYALDASTASIAGVCYGLFCLLVVYTVFLVIVYIEQVLRLINRAAKLRQMILLYLAIVTDYGVIYTLFEIARPGSFYGIDPFSYKGPLRVFQVFIDLFYFSNVCQASVGFGDISPFFGLGRVMVFTQSMVSIGFLSILFSNWIS